MPTYPRQLLSTCYLWIFILDGWEWERKWTFNTRIITVFLPRKGSDRLSQSQLALSYKIIDYSTKLFTSTFIIFYCFSKFNIINSSTSTTTSHSFQIQKLSYWNIIMLDKRQFIRSTVGIVRLLAGAVALIQQLTVLLDPSR